MLSDQFLQELKYRSDIEQVVGSYVNLRRRGRTLSGLCPFHSEKSPSFTVYPDTQSFFCFGCGAAGDVINFIRRIENLDYMEAVRLLAQRAGMQVPEEAGDDRSSRQRKRILELNRDAARYFHRSLMSEAGRPGRAYLIGRGLTRDTIVHFGIGYAAEGWDGLANAMRQQGYTKEELLAAHLVSERARGGIYDTFRNRAIFPIIDLRGNVIAFGGRNLGEKGPKYLNSSDTPVFKKSRNLFALNFAKGSPRKGLILCEGYMDVVSLHQAGFTNAVATLGTALTEEQCRLIAQYTGEVLLSYDSDGPGQAATRRATGLLEAAGVKIKVLSIPDAKDPDEFIKKFGAERFGQLIEGSSSATDFAISKLRGENDVTTAEGKVSFLKQFAVLMAGLPNPIEREVYLSKICRELEVDKAAVAGQIEREQKKRSYRDRKKEERELISPPMKNTMNREDELLWRQHPREMKAAERLLRYLLRHPDQAESLRDRLPENYLLSEGDRTLYRALLQRGLAGRELTITALGETLPPQVVDRVAKWQLPGEPPVNEQEAEDCLRCLQSHAAQISREELGQLSGEALKQYIAALNREKNRRGE